MLIGTQWLSFLEARCVYPDEAERWFAFMFWPPGLACPGLPLRLRTVRLHPPRQALSPPRHPQSLIGRLSVRTGVVMADSKLGDRIRALAIDLLSTRMQGFFGMKPSRELGITQESVYHFGRRIRVQLFGRLGIGLRYLPRSR